MTSFIAIDVETSNPDRSSICQIGIARYSDGQLVDEWSTLIDPEAHFDAFNIKVHGIRAQMVEGKPKMPEVAEKVRALMRDTVTVCHTQFDRVAVNRAFSRYGLLPVETSWLDSSQVARSTWPDLAGRGFGLWEVCHKLGHKFNHHDALEDAKAAGFVVLSAMQESGLCIQDWLAGVKGPAYSGVPPRIGPISRDGNPGGELFGEVLVFTGAIQLDREVAAEVAAQAGCRVAAGVNKKTTLLVVGDQDVTKLAGYEKSSKHRKAEELAMAGSSIRILMESDFLALVKHAPNQPQSN